MVRFKSRINGRTIHTFEMPFNGETDKSLKEKFANYINFGTSSRRTGRKRKSQKYKEDSLRSH